MSDDKGFGTWRGTSDGIRATSYYQQTGDQYQFALTIWLAATAKLDEAVEAEQIRWQERFEFLHKDYGVDGGGCDSGDPLDFTEAEVNEALNGLEEKLDEANRIIEQQKHDIELLEDNQDGG